MIIGYVADGFVIIDGESGGHSQSYAPRHRLGTLWLDTRQRRKNQTRIAESSFHFSNTIIKTGMPIIKRKSVLFAKE